MKKIFLNIILISGVILFIFFELKPSLKTPDMRGDEARAGCITLQLINNLPDNGQIILFQRHLPLVTTHHGALECYILAPFILLGGVTVEALRIGPILFGVIIILLTYWFASKLFNPYVGILSAILLAINGFFISIIKMGDYYGFSLPFFSLLSLSLFLKYVETKRNLYFYLGMFILGLGFNVKGFFIWFIIALFLTGFLFCRRIIKIKVYCIGFINLFIGASPILYFYYNDNFFQNFILKKFFITANGVNNLHFFNNLLIRIKNLNDLLIGQLCFDRQHPFGFPIFLFLACIIFLLYKITFERKFFPKRKIGFLLVLTLLIIITSVYTFTNHQAGHLILILPYIPIIIAVSIWQIFKSNNYGKMIALSLIILLVGYHLKNCISMIQQLEKEEQKNKNSNIYIITKWLLDNKFYNVLIFEEDSMEVIRFNSNFKIYNSFFDFWLPELYQENNIYSIIKCITPDTIFILRTTPDFYSDKINNFIKTSAKN